MFCPPFGALTGSTATDDIYFDALSLFPRIVIFANGVNDLTVPYASASISTHDPFINYAKDALCIELEGRTVARYYAPDPDEEEVELEVAPSPIVTPPNSRLREDRPWLPPVFYLNNWRGPLRYALFPLVPLLVPTVLTVV